MNSNLYALSSSRFRVHSSRFKRLSAFGFGKANKNGQFPLSPLWQKVDLGGFVIMAQYKSPQSPLVQRGVQVVCPFSKGGPVVWPFSWGGSGGVAFFKGGFRWCGLFQRCGRAHGLQFEKLSALVPWCLYHLSAFIKVIFTLGPGRRPGGNT